MLGAIKYNLGNLTNFSGRDARQTFWYYVLFLVICQFLIGMAISLPMMFSAMSESFSAIADGGNEQQVQAEMMANMSGSIGQQIWLSAAVKFAVILLLVAAFVRRLHDSGHAAYWVVLAIAAQLIGLALQISSIDELEALLQNATANANPSEMLAQQSQISRYALIGWVGPLIVIIFGVMKSTDGPNQHGDEPVRF